jgi:hypothetical protein
MYSSLYLRYGKKKAVELITGHSYMKVKVAAEVIYILCRPRAVSHARVYTTTMFHVLRRKASPFTPELRKSSIGRGGSARAAEVPDVVFPPAPREPGLEKCTLQSTIQPPPRDTYKQNRAGIEPSHVPRKNPPAHHDGSSNSSTGMLDNFRRKARHTHKILSGPEAMNPFTSPRRHSCQHHASPPQKHTASPSPSENNTHKYTDDSPRKPDRRSVGHSRTACNAPSAAKRLSLRQ